MLCYVAPLLGLLVLLQLQPEAAALQAPLRRIAIVGAGAGGLTLANALRKLDTGVDEVEVFERSVSNLQPGTGGGIQINSGASILRLLGFGDELDASAQRITRVLTRAASGRVLLDLDVLEAAERRRNSGQFAASDLKFYAIMRDRLQQMLLAQLPDGCLQLGKEVTNLEQTDKGVSLRFRDGSASQRPYDMVVGADGIAGAVKAAVSGTETPAVDSGLRIQLGVGAGNRPSGADSELHQWFGGNTYALTATYGGIGGKSEMIAIVYQDRKPMGENIGWQTADVTQDAVTRLEERCFPQEVVNVAKGCDRFFQVGVRYRNPLTKWSSTDGRMVLLGDSAHAMPPTLGQGANQAIQDAYCLAERLQALKRGDYGSVREAVRSYEATRKPLVASLLAKSVFLGGVETLDGPVGAFVRDNFFSVMGTVGVAEKIFVDGGVPRV
ncbi:monooxygenase [Tribonema minus]|uniref:Monooxygenase n=1 Tax=Tribonema minus TaxID=303371 RepID=A0A836CJN1_9STRA|nr:monooxygenase [Tribonema minus]